MAMLWGMLILFLCLMPGEVFPTEKFWKHQDKLMHIFLYSVWTYCLLETNARLIKTLFFVLSLGIIIECIQENFIRGRSFELYDIFANCLGFSIGLIIYNLKSKNILRFLAEKNTKY